MEVALQQQALGLQLKQIEAQNKLANAETAKTLAEANKIDGVMKPPILLSLLRHLDNKITHIYFVT